MASCPICKSQNIDKKYLIFDYYNKSFTIIRCLDCHCLYYNHSFQFDFRANFEHNRNLRTYLEKTSDIETLTCAIYNFLIQYPQFEQGIDIGCGAGIHMDFIEVILHKKMTGFEPSAYYCKEGKETLKLDIVEDYFSQDYIELESIDFAICSQVLQMTPEPLLLLSQINHILKPSGVLFISTPDCSIIEPSLDPTSQISILSPGVHKVLFNEESLQLALQFAGFTKIDIYKKDGQLFVLASRSNLKAIDLFEPNNEIALSYYRLKLNLLDKNSSYFKGIWYRYYRNRIDQGEYQEAMNILQDCHWFQIWTTEEIYQITTLDRLFELNSSADAIIYYYTGIIFLNHLNLPKYAEPFFRLSFLLCQKIIQLQIEMCAVEKDIIWLAKFHEILSVLYQGKTEIARSEMLKFISIQDNGGSLPGIPPQLKSKAESIIKNLV